MFHTKAQLLKSNRLSKQTKEAQKFLSGEPEKMKRLQLPRSFQSSCEKTRRCRQTQENILLLMTRSCGEILLMLNASLPKPKTQSGKSQTRILRFYLIKASNIKTNRIIKSLTKDRRRKAWSSQKAQQKYLCWKNFVRCLNMLVMPSKFKSYSFKSETK